MQDFTLFIGKHMILSSLIAIVFLLLLIIEVIRAKRRATALSPQQVTQKINRENAVIIDIRHPDGFNKGHVIDARTMTASTLLDNPKLLDKYRTKPVVLICDTGTESQKTAAFLLKSGYNAYSLAGGMRAWTDAQLPVIKG